MIMHTATPIPPGATPAVAVRTSAFHTAARRSGCRDFAVVNGLQVPLRFGDPDTEYRQRVQGVVLCDASAERHVEVRGPDAAGFVQWITATDLAGLGVGACAPALLVDEQGGVVGDPMVLRLAADRYWLAQESAGLLPWVKGVSLNCGLDVQIAAPEPATLALEGPRAREVVDRLLGADVAPLGEREVREVTVGGLALVVSPRRCGALPAFSLRLRDVSAGSELWERVLAVGEACGIAAAVLSSVHRIEAGLPRLGAEMDADSDPFEAGVGGLVDLDQDVDFIGSAALTALAARGRRRRLVGITVEEGGPPAAGCWPLVADDEPRGELRSLAFSPGRGRFIGLAVVLLAYAEPGVRLEVEVPGGRCRCRVEGLPFG